MQWPTVGMFVKPAAMCVHGQELPMLHVLPHVQLTQVRMPPAVSNDRLLRLQGQHINSRCQGCVVVTPDVAAAPTAAFAAASAQQHIGTESRRVESCMPRQQPTACVQLAAKTHYMLAEAVNPVHLHALLFRPVM